MKRLLVTGASGFLGSAICELACEKGMDVVAFTRNGSRHPTLDSLPVTRFEGDLLDRGAMRRAMRDCDAAIHTAFLGRYSAASARDVSRVNGRGTEIFLECCDTERVQQVVVVDTISAFGASSQPELREIDSQREVLMPWLFPYLDSKLRGRRASRRYRDRLQIVTLYCSPLYGAGDKHSHTGGLIQYLASRRPWFAPPGGTSVTAISDAAAACLLAATLGGDGEYVVANEHLAFQTIYNGILEALESPIRVRGTLPRMLLPPLFVAAFIYDRLADSSWFCPYVVRNGFNFRYFSSMRTAEELGWRPSMSFDNAVREQIRWMQEHQGFQLPN